MACITPAWSSGGLVLKTFLIVEPLAKFGLRLINDLVSPATLNIPLPAKDLCMISRGFKVFRYSFLEVISYDMFESAFRRPSSSPINVKFYHLMVLIRSLAKCILILVRLILL